MFKELLSSIRFPKLCLAVVYSPVAWHSVSYFKSQFKAYFKSELFFVFHLFFAPFMGQKKIFLTTVWLYLWQILHGVTSMGGEVDVAYLTIYAFSGRNIMNQPLYRATFS